MGKYAGQVFSSHKAAWCVAVRSKEGRDRPRGLRVVAQMAVKILGDVDPMQMGIQDDRSSIVVPFMASKRIAFARFWREGIVLSE